MTKSSPRKPDSFRVEDVEVFVPPEPTAIPAEERALPEPQVRALPNLSPVSYTHLTLPTTPYV